MLHLNNLAPAAFINSSLFRDESLIFDEKYELLEDLPLWLELICKKRDVVFLDAITVEYRIHPKQVTTQNCLGINKKLLSDLLRLNNFRLEKKHYLAYLHHKFYFYLNSRFPRHSRWLKFFDPLHVMIYIFDRMGR